MFALYCYVLLILSTQIKIIYLFFEILEFYEGKDDKPS